MRTAFVNELVKQAEHNSSIVLITGDLGFGTLEPYIEKFPSRFINAGVAEQNMIGMAAGLALSGKIVFVYSIANFPTMRCLEQIRNDVAYHKLNVNIVAVGGGFTYGTQGYTHYGIEDLAIMGALPNLSIIAPGDPVETRCLLPQIINHSGPCYLRLGRAGEPVVHKNENEDLHLGKACIVKPGNDISIITTGGMLDSGMQVAERLSEEKIHARVISMHTYKPIDELAILAAASETKAILTLEEHIISRGLGASVADVLVKHNKYTLLIKIGAGEEDIYNIGTQEYMRHMMGGINHITQTALHLLKTM